MKNTIIATAVSTLIAFSANAQKAVVDSPVRFDDTSPSLRWYERDRLLGPRDSLEDAGISPFLYFDSIAAASVDGGIDTAKNYTVQTYAGVDLDLEKILGWDETTVKISMVDREGLGIAKDVGGIYDPMTINGGGAGQVTWLYQAWIEKVVFNDWKIKLGRTSMDEDFADTGLNRYSLSTSINGPIRSLMLDTPQIFSFPLALWGGRIKYNPNDEHQFQLGAYQINNNPFGTHLKGTDWSINTGDGVTVMAQYDWTPEVFGRPARFYTGLAGSFYEFDTFNGGRSSSMLAFYGRAEVEVIDDLKLFAFASYNAEDEKAKIPLQINAGANWKGLIPGRDDDHTVAFATYGQISDTYGQFVTMGPVSSEVVLELGHRIQLTPASYIQPAIQYIINPGGGTNGNLDNATVIGAWFGVTF
ncbi:MAG: carbohydrate porin [Verrucomicrobiales bacterium]|nr:carbohydrate porin [Verrucomicrobiales bacterium]